MEKLVLKRIEKGDEGVVGPKVISELQEELQGLHKDLSEDNPFSSLLMKGLHSNDFGSQLDAETWMSTLQPVCRSILETEWRKKSDLPEGSLAETILKLWEEKKEGKELWEGILETMKFDEGAERSKLPVRTMEFDEDAKRSDLSGLPDKVLQRENKHPPIEKGMIVRTIHGGKALELHANETHIRQQGGHRDDCTAKWTLSVDDEAEVVEVKESTGEFRLKKLDGGDQSYLASPVVAKKLRLGRLTKSEKAKLVDAAEQRFSLLTDSEKAKHGGSTPGEMDFSCLDPPCIVPVEAAITWREQHKEKHTDGYDGQGVEKVKFSELAGRGYVVDPGKGNPQLDLSGRSYLQRNRSPYNGRTPIEYASDLLCKKELSPAVRTIKPMERDDSLKLLGEIQRNEKSMGQPGVGGGWSSLVTNGFRAEIKKDAPLIASLPGGDMTLYNDVLFMALTGDFHFAITWELHYGDVWLANWLRELLDGLVGGAKAIVVTGACKPGKDPEKGAIGFAQASEVFICLALGVPFKVVFSKDLFKAFRPLLALAKEKNWDALSEELSNPDLHDSFVRHTDFAGKNALLTLIREAARPEKDDNGKDRPETVNKPDPAPLVKQLLDARADPFQMDFYGWNAAHMAARFATSETMKVLVDIDIVDQDGNTLRDSKQCRRSPLYRAMKYKNKGTIEALMDSGAAITSTEEERLKYHRNKESFCFVL